MFGAIITGRLVQTNFQQIEPTKYILPLENATAVNFMCVFLTGVAALPPGYVAGIYLSWPPLPEWKFLGYISNEKPSTILRVSTSKPNSSANPFSSSDAMSDNLTAQLGLSVEPQANIEAQLNAIPPAPARLTEEDLVLFSRKMLENFYNYASSFAVKLPNPTSPFATPQLSTYIPADVLEKWYANMDRRLKNDPTFWKQIGQNELFLSDA